MAQSVSADRPIYGLSHVYHSDFLDETPESIEDIAATYLAEIRQVQPEGPYHFCGFSAGGMITYEMARQLLDSGASIGSLTLVEPSTRGPAQTAQPDSAYPRKTSRLGAIIKLLARAPMSLRARIRYHFLVLAAQFYFLFRIPLPETLRWIGYLRSLGPAMQKYEYKPIDCSAIFLYRHMGDEDYKYCCEFWNRLTTRGAQVESFGYVNKHSDFMLSPALEKTAELIENSIQ
jgi:thioesterase domain-containing protein